MLCLWHNLSCCCRCGSGISNEQRGLCIKAGTYWYFCICWSVFISCLLAPLSSNMHQPRFPLSPLFWISYKALASESQFLYANLVYVCKLELMKIIVLFDACVRIQIIYKPLKTDSKSTIAWLFQKLNWSVLLSKSSFWEDTLQLISFFFCCSTWAAHWKVRFLQYICYKVLSSKLVSSSDYEKRRLKVHKSFLQCSFLNFTS